MYKIICQLIKNRKKQNSFKYDKKFSPMEIKKVFSVVIEVFDVTDNAVTFLNFTSKLKNLNK